MSRKGCILDVFLRKGNLPVRMRFLEVHNGNECISPLPLNPDVSSAITIGHVCFVRWRLIVDVGFKRNRTLPSALPTNVHGLPQGPGRCSAIPCFSIFWTPSSTICCVRRFARYGDLSIGRAPSFTVNSASAFVHVPNPSGDSENNDVCSTSRWIICDFLFFLSSVNVDFENDFVTASVNSDLVSPCDLPDLAVVLLCLIS